MHDSLLLDDLIKSVLQEIGEFGLGSATFVHYRRAYGRLRKFAAQRKSDFFSDRLINSFWVTSRTGTEQAQSGVAGETISDGLHCCCVSMRRRNH